MKHYTYIDQSNFFLEGQRVAAVVNRTAPSIAATQEDEIFNPHWGLNYKRVYDFLCGGTETEVGCAKIFGSLPPAVIFWDALRHIGFEVMTFERAYSGKEKKVDVALTYHVAKDAYSVIDKKTDEINLVVGDTDYLPLVGGLIADGFRVTILFWGHLSTQFHNSGAEIINLNAQFHNFSR